ncbi:hypothetical protein TNIN_334781 [Trichonephila inaurata madagascariensis]|uniref:Uncharacterized protein n=1 Tax=Trichonephila inaurata madagascariensis TaxID=2747483 RepID=A0A8X6WVL9_9ARAC|nr:hypothetical protein TNIN_334781 [Trichonephila inaurata madagascariensis]
MFMESPMLLDSILPMNFSPKGRRLSKWNEFPTSFGRLLEGDSDAGTPGRRCQVILPNDIECAIPAIPKLPSVENRIDMKYPGGRGRGERTIERSNTNESDSPIHLQVKHPSHGHKGKAAAANLSYLPSR